MIKYDSFQVDPTTRFIFRHGHIYEHTSNPTLINLIQALRATTTIQAAQQPKSLQRALRASVRLS